LLPGSVAIKTTLSALAAVRRPPWYLRPPWRHSSPNLGFGNSSKPQLLTRPSPASHIFSCRSAPRHSPTSTSTLASSIFSEPATFQAIDLNTSNASQGLSGLSGQYELPQPRAGSAGHGSALSAEKTLRTFGPRRPDGSWSRWQESSS
jgi:hypothetical protein